MSEFKVECATCKTDIPYTEPVIMDQVIAGRANSDIQKDVLSHTDASTMTLEKLLSFVEGKESGMASQGLMSGNSIDNVSKKLKCRFCGESHSRGKQHCKAAGKNVKSARKLVIFLRCVILKFLNNPIKKRIVPKVVPMKSSMMYIPHWATQMEIGHAKSHW